MLTPYERKTRIQAARNLIIEALELLQEAAKDTRIEGEIKDRVEPELLTAALYLHRISEIKSGPLELRPWKLKVPTGLYASKYDHNDAIFDYLVAMRQGCKYNGDESRITDVYR